MGGTCGLQEGVVLVVGFEVWCSRSGGLGWWRSSRSGVAGRLCVVLLVGGWMGLCGRTGVGSCVEGVGSRDAA